MVTLSLQPAANVQLELSTGGWVRRRGGLLVSFLVWRRAATQRAAHAPVPHLPLSLAAESLRGTLLPSTLTFTADNWQKAQRVKLAGGSAVQLPPASPSCLPNVRCLPANLQPSPSPCNTHEAALAAGLAWRSAERTRVRQRLILACAPPAPACSDAPQVCCRQHSPAGAAEQQLLRPALPAAGPAGKRWPGMQPGGLLIIPRARPNLRIQLLNGHAALRCTCVCAGGSHPDRRRGQRDVCQQHRAGGGRQQHHAVAAGRLERLLCRLPAGEGAAQ